MVLFKTSCLKPDLQSQILLFNPIFSFLKLIPVRHSLRWEVPLSFSSWQCWVCLMQNTRWQQLLIFGAPTCSASYRLHPKWMSPHSGWLVSRLQEVQAQAIPSRPNEIFIHVGKYHKLIMSIILFQLFHENFRKLRYMLEGPDLIWLLGSYLSRILLPTSNNYTINY